MAKAKKAKKVAPQNAAKHDEPQPQKQVVAELKSCLQTLWNRCRAAGLGPGSPEHAAWQRASELLEA